MNIKGAIFDMDGTLLDSMRMFDSLPDEYLIKYGCVPEENLTEKVKTFTFKQAAEYFISAYGLKKSIEEILNDIDNMIADKYKYEVPLKSGVKQLLNEFKNMGVKMCVATATGKIHAEEAFKRLNIIDYFEDIITCVDMDCSKNKPDIYFKALDIIGTSINETLVFEDAYHAICTAKNNGFKVVAVYDEAEKSNTKSIKNIADIYCMTLDEWSERKELL